MNIGDVEIKLHQYGSADMIGESLVTDGQTFRLHSPYLAQPRIVSRQMAETILRAQTDITIADIAVVLKTHNR